MNEAEEELAPHSPKMPPSDFFCEGFLKKTIYRSNSCTIAALKVAITRKIQAITQEECARISTTVPSTEGHTSGVCIPGLLLTIFGSCLSLQILKSYPFYISINVSNKVGDYTKFAPLYSFSGLLHFALDPYLIMLSVKQGGFKYHFLSL